MALNLPADVVSIMLTDEFAEQIVYNFAAGGTRTINAIIDRNPPQIIEDMEPTRSEVIQIVVANDATSGVTSAEVNTGGDYVSLAPRFGGTASNRRVARIVEHDEGAMILELE
jgi:hypothetical protein